MKSNRMIKMIAAVILASFLCCTLPACGDGKESVSSDTGSIVQTDTSDVTTDGTPDSVPDTAYDALKSEDILDENGKITGKNFYNAEGYLISREIYDVAGRTVEYTTFNPSGDVSTSTKYMFLSGDKIDHYTFEIYEYEKGDLTRVVSRRYSGDDLLLSVRETDGAGEQIESFIYDYDDAGRMIREERADSKNVRASVTEYEYGEDGQVSRTVYKTGSGKLSTYTEYERDDRGKVTRDNNYDADGNLISYVEYVYDDKGEVAETHEYVPDEDGNFVEFG